MKKLIYIPILFFCLLTSCQKEYAIYSGESGLYFELLRSSSSTLIGIAFGEIAGSETSMIKEFEITLVGNVTDNDREFIFKAVELDAPKEVLNPKGEVSMIYYPAKSPRDYEILDTKPIVAAGANKAIVRVRFNRTDLAPKDESRMVSFILEENDHFKNIFPINSSDVDTQRISCEMSDKMRKPWWWESSSFDGVSIFGTYSLTKSAMICDKYGFDRKLWVNSESLSQIGGEGRLRYVACEFQRFLNTQTVPIMDEPDKDGKPVVMTMGKVTLENL